MKRKLTPTQLQDSIAELTDDVTELKETMQETKVKQSLAGEQFSTIFEALHHAAQNISQITVVQNRTSIAIEKLLEAQARADKRQARSERQQVQSEERLVRLEDAVKQLTVTVDRYLNARLNGGSKN